MVAVVNDYSIRTVVSQRFGTVFMVDGPDAGAPTLEGARSRSCGGGTAAHRGGD
jgi:hypothetical protein